MHIPLFPPLPALLCSALFYHPLSPLCLSLTPAETLSAECGGMGAQAPASLSHPTNIELHRSEEGGRGENQADLIYQKEDAWTVSKSPKQLEKRALEKRSSSAQSNEADMFFFGTHRVFAHSIAQG